MRRKIAALAMSGVLAGTLGTAVLVSPALASTGSPTPAPSKVSELQKVLEGLVSNGTLNQTQADKVAATLKQARKEHREHHHRRGHARDGLRPLGPEAVAKAIGITVPQLRTELKAGVSVTSVAKAHGVDRGTLVSKLVADAEARLAKAVTDGKLTQAQADQRKASLPDRIGKEVDRIHQPRPDKAARPAPGGPAAARPSMDLGGAPDMGAPAPA